MERIIRVTGKGRLSVKPDTIRLQVTQQSTERTYEGAVRESSEKKNELNTALEKLGFRKSELKTLSFNVETKYESFQAKDKSWQRRLVGYRYTHRMKLEFPADNKMLGRVLLAVARCPGEPEFSIEYTVADPEAAKNELLAKAVEDSKVKAEVLSRAAGVSLLKLVSIDYSWSELSFVTRPMEDMELKTCCDAAIGTAPDSIDLDIEADDIRVTDTVTVTWEIG